MQTPSLFVYRVGFAWALFQVISGNFRQFQAISGGQDPRIKTASTNKKADDCTLKRGALWLKESLEILVKTARD